MLALVFTALLLLTGLNYYLGRSFFYPAFVYCAAWTLALFCLLVSGNIFFPLSAETLSIFMWGAVAFSIGSAAGKFLPFKITPSPPSPEPQKPLTLAVAVLVLAFPFYAQWLVGLAAKHPSEILLSSTRTTFVELISDASPDKYTPQYLIFMNLLTATTMVGMFVWAAREGHKKRTAISILIAFAYFVLTGGRAPLIQFLLSLICIEWLLKRQLRWKMMLTVAVSSLVLFGVIGGIVHVGSEADFSERLSSMEKEFVGYISGPLVAFDRVVRDPRIAPHYPNASAFFVETAAKVFPRIEVPTRQSEFVNTGPDRHDNVFTIYFAYLDVGMPLAFFIIACEAFFLTIIYRFALAKRKAAVVMYSALLSCIVFSTFQDFFSGDINVMLKTYALCWMLYSFPQAKAKFGRFLHLSAKRYIIEPRSN